MPTYEYQCKDCEHRFEIWQKMADDALTVCPACQGALRRLFFPAGIVFKGSGFYKTDHGNGAVVSENAANGNGDSKESTTKTEATSESTGANGEKTSSEKASTASVSETKTPAVAD